MSAENLPSDNFGWIMTAVASVVSTLCGIIAMFYKQERIANAEAIAQLKTASSAAITELKESIETVMEKHEECVKDREGLAVRCASLEARLNIVEHKTEGLA